MDSLATDLLTIGLAGVSTFGLCDWTGLVCGMSLGLAGLSVLLEFSLGSTLLFDFLNEPSGKGRKSMGAVRAFFFLALVSTNRAPLAQLPPVNADF
tara:strand:- start:7 stop:294 length:288 start_codon:yes stop_codon:yes gene_type:complete